MDRSGVSHGEGQVFWGGLIRGDMKKVPWSGRITAVQPRIRLMRSFDQRHHSYQGYVLRIDGEYGSKTGEFLVAVGKAAHNAYKFCSSTKLSGFSVPVIDHKLETSDLYKTSGIKILEGASSGSVSSPPFLGVPPDLKTYRNRGHRRLETRTYESKCLSCIWGCRMPVEIIIDHWNPSKKKYRFETFCYGPKSCSLYRAGATRKVPGRGGSTWEEEDWVDNDYVSHRGPDE